MNKKIGFQSRRRLILRRWSYNWKRGVLFKALEEKVKGKLFRRTKRSRLPQGNDISVESNLDNNNEVAIWSEFVQTESYENRVLKQPIATQFKRGFGLWEGEGCVIKYFDEQITNGEKRRSVLFASGVNTTDMNIWKSFIEDTKRANQDYIEIFSTDPRIDSIFQNLGAWKIDEAPIMVRGLDIESMGFHIQPWDRENWTNLSNNNK